MKTKNAQHTKGRLYYHKTDGGAEYLCAGCINDNANAADLGTAVARLDGTPELFPLYAAAQDLLAALSKMRSWVSLKGHFNSKAGEEVMAQVNAAIARAEAQP
jgi:hypothetical protein